MDATRFEVETMNRDQITTQCLNRIARFVRAGRLRAFNWLWVLVAFTVAMPGSGEAAGIYEQVFVLQPGWNAVYLEVEPVEADVQSAFAGVPIASVWTWMPTDGTVEFIQDPDDGMINTSGWLGYFPWPRPEAFLTNLYFLQANRAYLVKVEGTQPITWRVEGRPSLQRTSWVSDSFNFTGLHVDPNGPPTFGAYFGDHAAHEGQPIYRLDPSGTWISVQFPHSTTVRSGEAYWMYCKGNSDFDGPLHVEAEWGNTMDFGASLSNQALTVQNLAPADTDITITQLNSSVPVPLSLIISDELTDRESWAILPTAYAIPAFAGQFTILRFGVRRAELTEDVAEQVLEITNGFGARRLVLMEAKKVHPALAPPGKSGGPTKAAATPLAGLWRGQVLVNRVSEAQMGGSTPVSTGKDFPLRYIIHVDGEGTVKLLKDVIEMWEDGTLVPSPDDPDFLIVDTPGRPILLTDEDLIPGFTGAVMRDGIAVGIRLSTVAYTFPEEYLEMNGALGLSGTLNVTITMNAELPTNPFLYRYHPDHNNLDEQYLNYSPEAYEVTRNVLFVFDEVDPSGENPPGWGDSVLGGTYFEEMTGVHRNTIYVGGTFRLERVSGVTELNR